MSKTASRPRYKVKVPQWGECARSGMRYPVDELVKDGQLKGLLVHKSEYDPKHPQELRVPYRPERKTSPAPEISADPNEGVEAPALSFDDTGKLT